MAYLVVLEGLDTGKVYELCGEKTIGSAIDNDIVLQDRRVYKRHLSIYSDVSPSTLSIHSPSKPVEINGKNVIESVLQQGDIIRIGSTMLLYVEGEKKDWKKEGNFFSFLPIPFILNRKENTEVLSSIQVEEYKDKVLKESKENGSLKTLVEINSSINEIPNLSLLLHQILSILLKEINADRSFVMLVHKNQKWEVASLCQKEDPSPDVSSFEYSKAITKKVLTRKMSLLYNPSSLDRKDIPSCISVPLNRKNKLLGLIQMESLSGYIFTKHDLDQLQKVAQQIAIAIDNLYFYQQPLQYYQKLILLEKFSQEFCQYLRSDKILQEAANAASSIFMSDRVSILVSDESKKELILVYSTAIPQEKWHETRIPFDKGLAGQAFIKNKPILIQNTRNIPESCHRKNYHTSSCILSPIPVPSYQRAIQQKAMGVICVTEKKDSILFTEVELRLLTFFANQLGAALANARLYEKATTDSLTKLYSRGYFFQCLQERISSSQLENTGLSLLMLDIDSFKHINDTYSHPKGDSILQQTGDFLRFSLQQEEIAGRYGGEEFLILISENHEKSLERAQNIQEAISQNCFWIDDNQSIPVTVSIGVSTLQSQDVSQSLIERADQALYLAKQKGRNQVVSEKEIV